MLYYINPGLSFLSVFLVAMGLMEEDKRSGIKNFLGMTAFAVIVAMINLYFAYLTYMEVNTKKIEFQHGAVFYCGSDLNTTYKVSKSEGWYIALESLSNNKRVVEIKDCKLKKTDKE